MHNPGVSKQVRTAYSGVAGVVTGVLASSIITWPTTLPLEGLAALAGSAVIGTGFGAATWLLIRVRKTQRQLAIAEFRHLGVSDDLIDNVVLKARDGVSLLTSMEEGIKDNEVGLIVTKIIQALLKMVDAFANDPGDIRGSRAIISRVVEQAPKIMDNFIMAEKSGSVAVGTRQLTMDALQAILKGLREQQEKNDTNNLMALEVDAQVTKDLFQQRTKA